MDKNTDMNYDTTENESTNQELYVSMEVAGIESMVECDPPMVGYRPR